MDIVTAFLYKFFDKIIYVEQPYLFYFNPELVYCLHKVLYKLKQALQISYQTLTDLLKKFSLEHLKLDHSIFVLRNQQIYLAVYVNDLLFFDFDDFCLIDIQDQHNAQFKITNLREISYYLGIKVDIEVEKKIFLCQTTYPKKILERFQIINCNLVSVPISSSIANSLYFSDNQKDQAIIK